MNAEEIQKHVNELAAAMLAKGMRQPNASIRFSAHAAPNCYLEYKTGIERSYGEDSRYHFARGETVSGAIENAAAWIAAQPNAKQAKLQDFMSALGKVIDLGREHSIEVGYMNPIVETMRKLSENIITDQRHAEAAE